MAGTTAPSPISDEQAARFGAWVARSVRRLLCRPRKFKFRVLTKDGQWHDEEGIGYGREDAREYIRRKHDQIEEILDL